MAYQKTFIFDVEDLVRLLTHYFDGRVPLDAEVTAVGVNPLLERFIGIELKSKEWQSNTPLQLRYDGERVMGWSKDMQVKNPEWVTANETPNRQ